MLDDLESVDWKNLSHAYGPAIDVPDQIRALASSDAETRSDGYGHLFFNIYHQGSVYSATPYVVPFLLELLNDPATLDIPKLLSLLQCLATGGSYGSKKWCAPAARDAVKNGLPRYKDLLLTGDPETRKFAALLLGSLEDSDTLQSLSDRLERDVSAGPEENADVISTILFAVSEFESFDCECVARFRRHPDPCVRFAVCYCYSRHAPDFIDLELIDVVIEFAALFDLSEEYQKIPILREEYLNSLASEILSRLDLKTFPSLPQILLKAVPRADLDGVDTVVDPLLHHTFPERKREFKSTRRFTPFQCEVLRQISNATLFWDSRGIAARTEILKRHGIPTEHQTLVAMLQ